MPPGLKTARSVDRWKNNLPKRRMAFPAVDRVEKGRENFTHGQQGRVRRPHRAFTSRSPVRVVEELLKPGGVLGDEPGEPRGVDEA